MQFYSRNRDKNSMDDEAVAGNVQSNPHWIGDPSKVRGPESDGSFSIPVGALNITWGNDSRYWERLKLCETEVRGFEEGAALQQVNWLEVRGKFQLRTCSVVPKCYKVYYVMKFNEDAFGWSHAPIKFKLAGDSAILELNLNKYREKPMTWHKVYVGKFNVVGDGNFMSVELGMFQVDTDWWKGGLVLAGIRLEPDLLIT